MQTRRKVTVEEIKGVLGDPDSLQKSIVNAVMLAQEKSNEQGLEAFKQGFKGIDNLYGEMDILLHGRVIPFPTAARFVVLTELKPLISQGLIGLILTQDKWCAGLK